MEAFENRKIYKQKETIKNMENGWDGWVGKKVFLRLRTGKVFSGKITYVSEEKNGVCFLKIKDKFNMDIMFNSAEVLELKEER